MNHNQCFGFVFHRIRIRIQVVVAESGPELSYDKMLKNLHLKYFLFKNHHICLLEPYKARSGSSNMKYMRVILYF
jgi:hypothetical protein